MGLVDKIKDRVTENVPFSGSQGIMGVITELMQQNNGIPGLMQKFQSKNMGNMFNSWVGKGENMPIEPNQVEDALGPDTINHLAQKSGMPRESISQQLSEHLPNIVDRMTPNGEMPTERFSKEHLVSMASTFFKKAS